MIFLTDENFYLTAYIKGDISSPNLNGIAYFKPFKDGVMVEVEVSINHMNFFQFIFMMVKTATYQVMVRF